MKITVDVPQEVADLALEAARHSGGVVLSDGKVNDQHPKAQHTLQDYVRDWLTEQARTEHHRRAAQEFEQKFGGAS